MPRLFEVFGRNFSIKASFTLLRLWVPGFSLVKDSMNVSDLFI